MEPKKTFSMGFKMYMFVIFVVLAASFGVAVLSYYIDVDQIDSYFKRLSFNSAENFATFVDPEFLDKLADVAESEEFQELRVKAEEDDDNEQMIEDYLREKGLWEEYADTREKLNTYLSNMDDLKYLYKMGR